MTTKTKQFDSFRSTYRWTDVYGNDHEAVVHHDSLDDMLHFVNRSYCCGPANLTLEARRTVTRGWVRVSR